MAAATSCIYSAKTGRVGTIDGRETAPAAMPFDAFIDPATGRPYRFTPELVTSGGSVGVPGTPATWERALERWRRREARRSFVVRYPVVGRFLESLDTLMSGVVDGVNEFLDFRAALPVALEFFAAAGLALFVSLPLAVLALIVSYREAKRRKAEFVRYKLQVEELRGELDEIKRHLGYANRS